MQGFDYSNSQIHQSGGEKTIRKVIIKNGKGHKSVKYYKNKKLISKIKRDLDPNEVLSIKNGKFIPGLFKDCLLKKTRKKRNCSSYRDQREK